MEAKTREIMQNKSKPTKEEQPGRRWVLGGERGQAAGCPRPSSSCRHLLSEQGGTTKPQDFSHGESSPSYFTLRQRFGCECFSVLPKIIQRRKLA